MLGIRLKRLFSTTPTPGGVFTGPSRIFREGGTLLEAGGGLGGWGVEGRGGVDHELPEGAVFEYSVGPYRISIVGIEGEYLYISELVPRPSRELSSIIEKASLELFRYAPEDRDLDDYYIAEVLSKVYRIPQDHLDASVYLVKERLRYGKIQVLLDDPYVEDISISGPGPVWVRHKSVVEASPDIDMVRTNIVLSMDDVVALQRYISTRCGTYLSKSNPIVDTQLPQIDGGHRIHMVGPIVAGERPEISIRKKPRDRVNVDWLIERGSIKRSVAEYLKLILWNRGSVVIAGPPSSGKTTLLKALLYSYIPPSWKVVVIEDTPEVDIPENSPWVRYTSYELGYLRIDQFLLAKAALRSSANRLLVIGETRGAEAQVLSQALNMGMGAITTFHGGSSEEVITRLLSPPISLSEHQVGSIWAIVVMGIGCQGSGRASRCVQKVDEIVPTEDGIRVANIYSLEDAEPSLEDLMARSARLPPRVRGAVAVGGLDGGVSG